MSYKLCTSKGVEALQKFDNDSVARGNVEDKGHSYFGLSEMSIISNNLGQSRNSIPSQSDSTERIKKTGKKFFFLT